MYKILKIFIVNLLIIFFATNVFATNVDPGSKATDLTDFTNITKGLYYDGVDYYYLLDTGVIATNYILYNDGQRYFFDEFGKMVREDIVELDGQKYYFDSNGYMVKNQWIYYNQVDEVDGTTKVTAYYFGPSGRAYKADGSENLAIKTIDGSKYGFNSDGERLEGFVSFDGESLEDSGFDIYKNCLYYFDPEEEYAACKGWLLYTWDIDSNEYSDTTSEYYMYFDEKTGRKVYSKTPGRHLARIIEGQRYLFDENGFRVNKWVGPRATDSNSKYYIPDEEGYLAKGWFTAVPRKDSVEADNREYYSSDDEKWFYGDKSGRLIRNTIKKIGKYFYAFDQDGVMLSDCLAVVKDGVFQRKYKAENVNKNQLFKTVANGGILNDGEKIMYFLEPDNEALVGSMCQTNSLIKIELKDTDVQFCANAKGGYGDYYIEQPILRNNKFYQNGILLKPEEDSPNYGIIKTTAIKDASGYHSYAVVNRSGVIIKRKSVVKDSYSQIYICIDENGFAGAYTCQVKYNSSTNRWFYKVDAKWEDGLPPDDFRANCSGLFLNFDKYEGPVDILQNAS